MKLNILKEKVKSLSDENIDKELVGKKNIKTFKYDAEAMMKLAANYVVITTKDREFMHIDIEDAEKIIQDYSLELVV